MHARPAVEWKAAVALRSLADSLAFARRRAEAEPPAADGTRAVWLDYHVGERTLRARSNDADGRIVESLALQTE